MERLIFNKYKILKTIPAGEKTSFYLVEDIDTGVTLLLKQIKIDTSGDFYKPVIEEYREKSKEPMKIDKKPSSPAILDFFMDEDSFYIVLEYRSERSLRIAVSYPSIGKIINNRYVIVNGIASGGFGVVYLSRDLNLPGKHWAVKEMHQAEGIPLEVVERSFRIEAQILAGLEHPNIPGIVDFFVEDKKLYLVMDYITGETVDKMIKNLKEQEYFPEDTVITWAITICNVLQYLHERPKPIIFRDMKPSNIMITGHGDLKLIDFGIAKIFQGCTSQVTQYALLTGGYAPPEQWLGRAEPKSDIYALGATLFHILTRHHPRDFTPYFPPVHELNSSVSEALSRIIAKALQIKPHDRFQSIGEVKQELINLQSVKKGSCHISMAREYEAKGDFFSANFEYMKALDFDDKNYQILLSIARCFEKLGFFDRASDVYHKILNMNIPEEVRNSIPKICKPSVEEDDELTVVRKPPEPEGRKKQEKAHEEEHSMLEIKSKLHQPSEEVEIIEEEKPVEETSEKNLQPAEEVENVEEEKPVEEISEMAPVPSEEIGAIEEDRSVPEINDVAPRLPDEMKQSDPVISDEYKKHDPVLKNKIQSIQEIKNEFFKLHSKKKSQDYIYKAREYENRGDCFNANLQYVRALELDKENHELLLSVAMCCEKAGLKKKSLEYYNRLLERDIPEKLRKEIQENQGVIRKERGETYVEEHNLPAGQEQITSPVAEYMPQEEPVRDRTVPVELTEFVSHEESVRDRTVPISITEPCGQTMVSSVSGHDVSDAAVGKLTCYREGKGSITYRLDKTVTRIGRAPGNDLYLDYDPQVSSRHAVITLEDKRYFIEDLGSTNKTYVNGIKIDAMAELNSGDEIKIGNMIFNFVHDSDKKPLDKKPSYGRLICCREGRGDIVFFIDRNTVTIGRAPGNDICLDSDPQVSSRHAMITVQGNRCFIEDLGSTNSTYVNGLKVDVKTELKENDEIKTGNSIFMFEFY
ncbi:MAG: FHA domain-containing serine/threonine-protein kinase [Candidatus Eremiobacterota bacterium]